MLKGVGVGLGLVLLLLVVGVLYLLGDAGEKQVLARVLAATEESLAGRLQVEELEVGLDGLSLKGVELYTPEGERVARIERLSARAKVLALARKRVQLSRVDLEGVQLWLVQDEDGLNLQRALAAKVPKPEEPPGAPSPWVVELDALRLTGGRVDFRQEGGEGPDRQVTLEALEAEGRARYAGPEEALSARLKLTGAVTAPVPGPLQLELEADGKGEGLAAQVALTLAGLEGRAQLSQASATERTLTLPSLSLTPEMGRGLLPSWPLRVPVRLSGTAAQKGDVWTPALELRAGKARATLSGLFDQERLRGEPLLLEVAGVDLRELLGEAPALEGQAGQVVAGLTDGSQQAPLSARLEVRGGGLSLETLSGRVALDVSASRLDGHPVGPVRLRASAEEGRVVLQDLRAVLPGLTAEARGEGDRERVAVAGKLQASDLGLLARTLHLPVEGLAGRGGLSFRVEGPTRHPGLTAEGRFGALASGGLRVSGLTARARVPDVTRPLGAQAELRADRVRSGESTYETVALTLARGAGDALVLDASVAGPEPLRLHAEGVAEEDGKALALSALLLGWPEAEWRMEGRSHLAFREGFALAPLRLTASGGQSLTLRGRLVEERLEADVGLGSVDLARLPRLFVDRELGLAGTVSGEVAARGRTARPDVTARLSLADAAYRQYRDVDAELTATWARDRARGTLTARLPPGAARATFDVPVRALQQGRRAPLSLEVVLEEVLVERALAWAGRADPYAGAVRGRLAVSGTADDPRLALELVGEGLHATDKRGEGLPRMGVTLTARSEGARGALASRLELRGVAREAWVTLATPRSLADLRRAAEEEGQLLRTPVTLAARLEEVPLQLAEAMDVVSLARGTASLALDFEGPAQAPLGRGRLTLAGASVENRPRVDGSLTLDAEGARTLLTARTRVAGQRLLTGRLELAAPLARLLDTEALARVPLTLEADAGPVSIATVRRLQSPGSDAAALDALEAGLAVADNRAFPAGAGTPAPAGGSAAQAAAQAEAPFDGRARLTLTAKGTLADPEVRVELGLTELGRGALALGRAAGTWTYRDARHALDLSLSAPGGGTLALAGATTLDVSLPALQRGLDLSQARVDGRLTSRAFAMDFLSGATAMVRRVGGVLDADATFEGPLRAPAMQGRLEWREGRLALAGYGEYRGAHLALQGSRERVVLEDFSAQSGAGSLRLTGEATRAGEGYQLRAQGEARRFPLVNDDQLVAVATLKDVSLRGTLTPDELFIERLHLPDTTLELPETKSKDVQGLDKPEDVVLVRDGVPVNPAQRKRTLAARQKARLEPEAGAGGAGTGADGAAGGAAQAEAGRMRYTVRLDAPRNVWIRGPDIDNLELGFSNDFRVQYVDRTLLYGEVRVLRGRVSVLGRTFDVQRDSQVRFTGPANQPFINASAVHLNEREQVKVTIAVRGQGKDFTLKPTSEPPLPETEIYTLLATGRRNLRGGSSSGTGQGAAASALGGFLAGQVKNTLANRLPIDVLTFEAGDQGLEGARLGGGVYLSDKLFVGYTHQLGSARVGEDVGKAQVEWQLSPRWSLEGEVGVGERRKTSADLIWRKDF